MTVEEILAALQAIIDDAGGEDQPLTEEQAAAYEALEVQLAAAQRNVQIRNRHAAYHVVTNRPGQPQRNPGRGAGSLMDGFTAYLRSGQPNADISGLHVQGEQFQLAQGEGTSAGGGYTVPTEFREKMVEVRKSFGGFEAEVETLNTTKGNPLEYPSNDDTANEGDITAESAAVASGADLVFGQVNLGAYKYTAAGTGSNLPVRVPVELITDSFFDITGFLARKLTQRLKRKQAPHWVTGTGVGQPKGILAASLTADRDLDTADTPDYQDLVEFQDLLDEEYDGNAKWLMRKNPWTQIRLIVDLNGRPLVQASTEGIAGRPARTLLDRPVVIDEAAPLLSSAADTFPIAYGDFREAYILRRVGDTVVFVNPYTRAANGEVEYHAWERADGNIQNRSAYKILQNNT